MVVVGLRELVCDVSGPDYPLSTDLSSSWRLLPRRLLLAWWLPRPLTLRRDVSERAVSAVDVPVERVASVAVLPVTCVVVLGTPACGRDVSEPYSSVVGDLSSSWRLFFLLLDTCWGVIGSSSLDLTVPEPCHLLSTHAPSLGRLLLCRLFPCVGEVDPSEVGRTIFLIFAVHLTPSSLSAGVSLHG